MTNINRHDLQDSNKDVSTSDTSDHVKLVMVLLGALLIILVVVLILRANSLQKTAEQLDAKVDWKAVLTHKQPIYKVQRKVVRIKFDNYFAFKEKTSQLGLHLDEWSEVGSKSKQILGGATASDIKKLQDAGYTVEILYNSYDEYLKAMKER